MFKFLTSLFIKNYKNTNNSAVRQKYGLLSGMMGILCNLFLFIIKITVGLMINSVAVISDAFNNFSDMGSTLVSIIGIKLSNMKPDREHPFGHGRFEYISALIVSFIIMVVGLELLKSSVDKIINPVAAQEINWLLIGLLAISIPVKLFMYGMNKYLGKAVSSMPLIATALDSRNDCFATGAVIISAIVDGLNIFTFTVDGYVGALVSLLIMYAGFSVAKDTIGLLLGKVPEKETVNRIHDLLLETPEIIDIHDLIVHDYGPGRLFASVHAEIKDDANIIAAHEAIDAAEKHILNITGCEITIHMDPVCTDDERLINIKKIINDIFNEQELSWSIHDLRMTGGESNINIIFDMVVPYEAKPEEIKTVTGLVKDAIKKADPIYSVVIQIDRDFVNRK